MFRVEGKPVLSGTVKYGSVPAGLTQKFPATGATPSALQSGKQYYGRNFSDSQRKM
jgi:hypothetical protein